MRSARCVLPRRIRLFSCSSLWRARTFSQHSGFVLTSGPDRSRLHGSLMRSSRTTSLPHSARALTATSRAAPTPGCHESAIPLRVTVNDVLLLVNSATLDIKTSWICLRVSKCLMTLFVKCGRTRPR